MPVFGALRKLTAAEIGNALEVIDKRNKIVHEGWDPSADPHLKQKIMDLFKTIAKQIPGPSILFPSANHSNRLTSSTSNQQFPAAPSY
jgi:hypothetical protein